MAGGAHGTSFPQSLTEDDCFCDRNTLVAFLSAMFGVTLFDVTDRRTGEVSLLLRVWALTFARFSSNGLLCTLPILFLALTEVMASALDRVIGRGRAAYKEIIDAAELRMGLERISSVGFSCRRITLHSAASMLMVTGPCDRLLCMVERVLPGAVSAERYCSCVPDN